MSGAVGGTKSSGQSSGSSTSQSTTNPSNLQLPDYTGLAPNVASGLNSQFNATPSGTTTPGGTFSPFAVGGNASNNPNANPLVAPTTAQQNETLYDIGVANQPGTFGITPGGT